MSHKKTYAEPMAFQIVNIEVLETKMDSSALPHNFVPDFRFEIQLENKAELEDEVLFVIVKIEILNADLSLRLGKMVVSCAFEIQGLLSLYDDAAGKLNLPEGLQVSLNSVAISTTRGIMFSQFKGTFLHRAFLPVVDPKQFTMKPFKG